MSGGQVIALIGMRVMRVMNAVGLRSERSGVSRQRYTGAGVKLSLYRYTLLSFYVIICCGCGNSRLGYMGEYECTEFRLGTLRSIAYDTTMLYKLHV